MLVKIIGILRNEKKMSESGMIFTTFVIVFKGLGLKKGLWFSTAPIFFISRRDLHLFE